VVAADRGPVPLHHDAGVIARQLLAGICDPKALNGHVARLDGHDVRRLVALQVRAVAAHEHERRANHERPVVRAAVHDERVAGRRGVNPGVQRRLCEH
jgi:hypothetical protein